MPSRARTRGRCDGANGANGADGAVASRGSIVNVSSVSAFKGANPVAPYAAAKAGLMALTRSVAAECGWPGVRCNCIIPSWVETS